MTFCKLDACPVCGGVDFREVVGDSEERRERYLKFSQERYEGLLHGWLEGIELAIDGCASCGHTWFRFQPEATLLDKMYATSSLRREKQNRTPDRAPTAQMISEMRRFRGLIKLPTKPKLLDYGSGYGRWARAAVQAGFDVTAYDPSAERSQETEEVAFQLINKLESLDAHSFDAVNLEQVLEHVHKPIETLQEIKKYCKEGTVIRMTVPNIFRCPEGKDLWEVWPFDGRRHHTMAPFEHLHGFTPNSLRCLVKRAGLRSCKGLKVWKNYPRYMATNLVETVAPGLGKTMVLAKVV